MNAFKCRPRVDKRAHFLRSRRQQTYIRHKDLIAVMTGGIHLTRRLLVRNRIIHAYKHMNTIAGKVRCNEHRIGGVDVDCEGYTLWADICVTCIFEDQQPNRALDTALSFGTTASTNPPACQLPYECSECARNYTQTCADKQWITLCGCLSVWPNGGCGGKCSPGIEQKSLSNVFVHCEHYSQ